MIGDIYSSEIIKEVDSLLIKINIKRIDMYNIREIIDISNEDFQFVEYSNLILDLRKVTYIDATAIGGLLEVISKNVIPKRGRVVLISEKDQIHRKVASYYNLYIVSMAETREEAIDKLKTAMANKAARMKKS